MMRKVILRNERTGNNSRHLEAYLDEEGALHIAGQDLGPATAMVSNDGEYEFFQKVAAGDVPRLAALLGASPGEGILDLLARKYTGAGSYELERLLAQSDIPFEFHCF